MFIIGVEQEKEAKPTSYQRGQRDIMYNVKNSFKDKDAQVGREEAQSNSHDSELADAFARSNGRPVATLERRNPMECAADLKIFTTTILAGSDRIGIILRQRHA